MESNIKKERNFKNKIITMSGQPVTGKSTAVRALKKQLLENGYEEENIHIINTGDEFRKYIEAIVELYENINDTKKMQELKNKKEIQDIVSNEKYRDALIKSYMDVRIARKDLSNMEISLANSLKELKDIRGVVDEIIDENIKKMGEEINQEKREKEIWIVDSRLAFHNIPDSFALRLICDPKIAGERTFKRVETEKYKSLEEATEAREKRRIGEQQRYLERYGVDLEDENNYDLIIDTSYAKPEDIGETIITCLEKDLKDERYGKKWVSPKTLLPLQEERETLFGSNTLEDIKKSIEEKGYYPESEIEIVEVDGRKYIIEGHHRNFAAANLGKTLVPVNVLAKDDEEIPLYKGATPRQRAETLEIKKLTGHEWLIDNNFSYDEVYPGIKEEIKKKEDIER